MEDKINTIFGYIMIFVVMCLFSFMCYKIGRQTALDDVDNLLLQEEAVAKDSIIIEDLRLDISKLR